MINQNLDRDFPEPAGMMKKVYELLKKDYSALDAVNSAVEKVIAGNKKAVDDFQNGNGNVIGFLIGQVQKELKGKGEPKLVQQLLFDFLTKK